VVTYHWILDAPHFQTTVFSWNIRHGVPFQKNGDRWDSLKTLNCKEFKLNIAVNSSTGWKSFQATNEENRSYFTEVTFYKMNIFTYNNFKRILLVPYIGIHSKYRLKLLKAGSRFILLRHYK
jgi:hypothetical protein